MLSSFKLYVNEMNLKSLNNRSWTLTITSFEQKLELTKHLIAILSKIDATHSKKICIHHSPIQYTVIIALSPNNYHNTYHIPLFHYMCLRT